MENESEIFKLFVHESQHKRSSDRTATNLRAQ
jgi:hypothetical protein